MFRSVLVANRGEIAVRVFRTARAMGLRCIAVHSEADAGAMHVAMADEAIAIGPAPASESYLRVERIIEAAKRTGAEAIHPGYGFLSENPLFAEACAAAGIAFVGPSASAMRAMGGKAAAKALMAAAGVPLVPGYHGEDQEPSLLAEEAARIGYPVLIKASAGGGGRGMRVVEREGGFAEALWSAQREAEAAFGDHRVLVEKYLARPRHIEVQVLADSHGATLALSSRDCSIQRRHQKIVEEAPAPFLPDAMRAALGEAAVAAAKAVGYVNAGTVEFIAEGDRFFFMEMNTRLQVEHPVTEAITGLDLVAWQLRIASGEKLPFGAEPSLSGHAIEVRLCAEEPRAGWRPAVGRLSRFVMPEGEGIRVDTGVREGDAVTPFYDSMVAKIIAHGATRDDAIARLRSALDATEVDGVATNLDALRAILAVPAFAAAAPATTFLAEHEAQVLAPPRPAPKRALLAAVAAVIDAERRQPAASAADPASPWEMREGWRLFGAARRVLRLHADGREIEVPLAYRSAGVMARLEGEEHALSWRRDGRDGAFRIRIDDTEAAATVLRSPGAVTVTLPGQGRWRIGIVDALEPARGDVAGDDRVASPIPGRVASVQCAVGDVVARGQVLVVVEAMKTELRIAAPVDGTVARVDVAAGDQVEEGMELVLLEPATASAQE
ncbi:acetyl/propionyl/methylcrotonyl-CoA carboxylase subunit alpha [Elioraea rosea]|uniref:acetyl/propionyl/methylcrotonyl-CoA carboxylase subunit alpha n=1 Tax=Elioraea rosea TaxID=2492390 RepID=UPI001185D4ED|nr:biotin carboxylase N-terminal domain-containing protein [Elioraea rosea]